MRIFINMIDHFISTQNFRFNIKIYYFSEAVFDIPIFIIENLKDK